MGSQVWVTLSLETLKTKMESLVGTDGIDLRTNGLMVEDEDEGKLAVELARGGSDCRRPDPV